MKMLYPAQRGESSLDPVPHTTFTTALLEGQEDPIEKSRERSPKSREGSLPLLERSPEDPGTIEVRSPPPDARDKIMFKSDLYS